MKKAIRVVHVLGVLLASVLASERARASPVFEIYGGANTGGGFNARVSSPSAASAYFNPALLPRAERGLSFGVFFAYDDIDIEVGQRSRRNDLPEVGVGKFRGGEQTALPTSWLEHGCDPATGGKCVEELPARPRQQSGSSQVRRPYATVGLVAPLIDKYLTAGVYTILPLKVFMSATSFYVDEREQFFTNSLHPELYSDRLDAISLALGLGSQLADALAIGVSLSIGMSNEANAATYVSDTSHFDESLRISTDVAVKLALMPHAAVAYTPTRALSISATVHSPQKLEIITRPAATLPVGDVQNATRRSVHHWLPWRVALGFQWHFAEHTQSRWSLTGHALYARWSQYENRHGERPHRDFAWRDTVSGALGLRHTLHGSLQSLLDLQYVRTPVPDQVGRENYVDNDRLGILMGTEYAFPKLGPLTVKLGVNAQLQLLRARTQQKLDPTKRDPVYPQLVRDEWLDGQVETTTGEVYAGAKGLQTNNPGWPGFSSHGLLAAGGLTLSVVY